jgi:hypothetical protein
VTRAATIHAWPLLSRPRAGRAGAFDEEFVAKKVVPRDAAFEARPAFSGSEIR